MKTHHIDGKIEPQMDEQMQALRNLWSSVLMYAVIDVSGKPCLSYGELYEMVGQDIRKKSLTRMELHNLRGRAMNTMRYHARQWFESDRLEPGCFLWICGVLGLNQDAVRERVLAKDFRLMPGRGNRRLQQLAA